MSQDPGVPGPNGIPMTLNFTPPLHYNNLISFSSGCQYYILPSGGQFAVSQNNLTKYPFRASRNVVLYAVNCDYNLTQYREVWQRLVDNAPRVPYQSSLTPLMVVLTICVVMSWILVGILAVIRRYKRPILHQFTLIYVCVLLTVLYVVLHHFSREEHMNGYESTDTFTDYFFSSKRSISIFLAVAFIMLCECHIICSIYTHPRHRLAILLGCAACFAVVQGVWIAGVADSRAFNVLERLLNPRIRIYFYLDIITHVFYATAYILRVLSMWRYAFTRRNGVLALVSSAGTAIPFISMIVTTLPTGCFRWSLPLSMVLRTISLVFAWDWHVHTITYKAERETEDPLGRLITQSDIKRELRQQLGQDSNSGDGYRTFLEKPFPFRLLDKIQNPRSLFSDTSRAQDDEEVATKLDSSTNFSPESAATSLSAAHNETRQTQNDSIIQHHPIAKHKVTNKGSTLKPLATKKSGLTPRLISSINESDPALIAPGLQPPDEAGANTGTTAPPSIQNLPSSMPAAPSGSNEPGSSSAADETPPGFVPHPGFRSGDYYNEKR